MERCASGICARQGEGKPVAGFAPEGYQASLGAVCCDETRLVSDGTDNRIIFRLLQKGQRQTWLWPCCWELIVHTRVRCTSAGALLRLWWTHVRLSGSSAANTHLHCVFITAKGR